MTFRTVRRLLFLLLFSMPAIAQAQGFVNAKYASDFLQHGAGGRSAALGGTGTASSRDVTAGYFNPAALSLMSYPQVTVFHEAKYSGLFDYDFAAAGLPIDARQTAALTVLRFGYGDIKDSRNALIDRNGNGVIDEDDRIDPSRIVIGGAADWAFIGSYARAIDEKLSVGGNVKVLHKSILDTSAWGVGVDLGVHYKVTPEFHVGAMLTDATKSLLAWETGHQEFIVPTLRLGGAYELDVTDKHSIRPAIDGIFRFEGREQTTRVDLGVASLDVAAGLEYAYNDRLFVRGGYNEIGQWTVGAGVKLPKLNIDYGFIPENNDLQGFGASHRISLMLTLEDEKYERGE